MIPDTQAGDVNAIVTQLQTQLTTNSRQPTRGSIIWRVIFFILMLISLIAGAVIASFDQYLQSLPKQQQAQLAGFTWTHQVSQILLLIATPLFTLLVRQEINDAQYKLLLAFSIFRQPVPLNAFQDFKDFVTNLSPSQIRPALDILLIQNLLRASEEGRYQIHAVVAMYIQSDFVETGESSYQQILRLQSAHIKAAQYYLQQFSKTGLPYNQRRQLSDVQFLIEAIWQYTQADLFQKAYDLAIREDIFTQLKSWGENTSLLELYQLLLSSDRWINEKREIAARMYQDLGTVYGELHQQEKAERCLEKANNLRQEAAIQP